MTTLQAVAVFALLTADLAVVAWVAYESSRTHPSRAYVAIKTRVDAMFRVLGWPIERLFATKVMSRLFR